MLITLDAVAESIDAVPRRADALTPGHASDVEERARTSEHDGLSHLESAAHVIGVLREAVLGNDAELLSNLSLVAESLSRNRHHTAAANPIGSSLTEYEAYVWHDAYVRHDADDDWCFAVPALDIEQRNHLHPSSIAWLAASAATLAGGVPANVRLIVGPSMDTADALDETEVPRVEEAARFSDAGVAEGRS